MQPGNTGSIAERAEADSVLDFEDDESMQVNFFLFLLITGLMCFLALTYVQLKKLFLSNNKIVLVSPAIAQLDSLHTLDLSGNNLTILPSSIVLLKSLERLKVREAFPTA